MAQRPEPTDWDCRGKPGTASHKVSERRLPSDEPEPAVSWPMVAMLVALLAFLLCLFKCEPVKAECITHTVKKGETLGKISEEYFESQKFWKDIKWQNDLKRNHLKVGQQIDIYIPDTKDWKIACRALVYMRIDQLGVSRPDSLVSAIVNGVADMNIGGDPIVALEQCRWAITTAHQESLFQFAVGGAGEIGIYQFKLDTVRLTGKWYDMDYLQGSDAQLVKLLLDTRSATKVFLLHYIELHKRYKGLWLAWKRYNNGSEAAAYASKAVKRYWEVRQLQPVRCQP
jgi:hypothetical protein